MSGLYAHVPFCLTRCGYCDFNAYEGLDHLRRRYAEALAREADLAAWGWAGECVDTVFFGGGTPTRLETGDLVRVLEHFREVFAIAADAEVTIEANPDTVDEGKLRTLREAGFTRLSMGAQSFDPAALASLERVHSPESVRSAFAAARRGGYDDVNLDLIFGAEGETLDSWRSTLKETLALDPEHVSAYALTVEANTPLGSQVAASTKAAPDPDLQADMFALACDVLRDAGFEHYEVSNWAKPGHECSHNLGYWRRDPYLGLGAGAHSYRDGRRWWNLRPPEEYLASVEAGKLPAGGKEHLTADDMRLEDMFLRLRTREGISAALVDADRADQYLDEGLLTRSNGRYILTERGMFLASDLVLALTG